MRWNARSCVAGRVPLRLKRSDEKRELDLAVVDDALSYLPEVPSERAGRAIERFRVACLALALLVQ